MLVPPLHPLKGTQNTERSGGSDRKFSTHSQKAALKRKTFYNFTLNLQPQPAAEQDTSPYALSGNARQQRKLFEKRNQYEKARHLT